MTLRLEQIYQDVILDHYKHPQHRGLREPFGAEVFHVNPVCGDEVRSVFFADNSLEYCPTCQTGGKILADRRLSRLLK